VTTVTAGERELGEQSGDALIQDGAIVAACLVSECGPQPTFADTGRAADQKIGVFFDPLALRKLLEQRAVETARSAIVDILDASLLTQLGGAEADDESLVAAE
jgi:hypothetical protein